jgi:LCP family protein required for cell wall assembly
VIVLALFVAGVLIGVIAERLTYRPAAAPDAPIPATGDPTAPRPKRRVGRIVAWVALVSVVTLVAVGAWAWQRANAVFDSIEKVDVSDVLSPPSGDGTNYLLVGSDNGRAGGEQREGVDGSRSDTIMVLRVGDDGSTTMLSLNRDLWVDNPASGEQGRLNATYNAGPANLIQAVTENFQIPVHRYIEVDFVSFAGMVDALGGITIDFAHPAFDLGSGLDVKQSGPVRLDGDQALAYVRSRYYAEVIDGEVVLQGGLPDVNRTQRQQTFLRAVMAEAADERNPLTLLSTADRMSEGLRIDDDMTMWQAARFAWDLRGAEPESVILPVTPRTTSGGAAVLELQQPEAEAVLAQFR